MILIAECKPLGEDRPTAVVALKGYNGLFEAMLDPCMKPKAALEIIRSARPATAEEVEEMRERNWTVRKWLEAGRSAAGGGAASP